MENTYGGAADWPFCEVSSTPSGNKLGADYRTKQKTKHLRSNCIKSVESRKPRRNISLLDDAMRDQIKARAFEVGEYLMGKPTSARTGSVRYGRNGSLKLNANGAWYSHEDGAGGDLVKLVAHVRGCSIPEAIAELMQFMTGKPQVEYVAPPVVEPVRWPGHVATRWNQITWDRRIAEYLFTRGIIVTQPLRNVKYSSFGGGWMCARADGADGKPMTIHRTFTGPVPQGAKRRREFQKGVTSKGGFVHLDQGRNDCAVIGEGIENALAYRQLHALHRHCLWAGLSAGNLPTFDHSTYARVIIAADNDRAGIEGAEKLAAKIRADGGSVEIAIPDAIDWNDELLGVKS
ncbi:toprim domain-containing protein [Tateyamaria sp.]|uniref:toprim domain-containing protein n=1 Tax=Tateyamaria sp. TaxID=1929288 RepID=UPI00329DBFDB